MKKVILTAVCALLSTNAFAAQTNFDYLDFVSQVGVISAAAQAAPAALPVPVPLKAKTGRYVQVSGHVSLSGHGWMPQNGGYTSVMLTGWGSFRDGSGQVASNNTYINVTASMFVRPNQSVFQTVWPSVYAQFSRNGKPLGSVNMTGSVSVTGWPSGTSFSLSGSGYLNGSIYVEDER